MSTPSSVPPTESMDDQPPPASGRQTILPLTFGSGAEFNMASHFLEARLAEGLGEKVALICGERRTTYAQVDELASRFGHVLRSLGVEQEQRVIVALPDGPEWVGAFFGILKIGAVVVMVNPGLKPEEIAYFYDYTRAKVAVLSSADIATFEAAASSSRHLRHLLTVGPRTERQPSFEALATTSSGTLPATQTHRDDGAIWLFSGGTTGQPKAVVQTHASFANTTELYAKRWLGYRREDVTLSVPKLFFGYATGSNLLFPFSVGATSVLFPERCTADALFAQIAAHRPTILVNVPTMVNQMVSHPDAARQDLSCLRFATSAGEALPAELYDRWRAAFKVDLLDGLGTAEMWHIFISSRPGEVRPGTLGRVVDGFEVKVCDGEGRELPPGEMGELWVRGNSRAIAYWQQHERSAAAFRGEWYVSGDLIARDADGYVTYGGRGDDMLKVGGKWVAPKEVESCLLQHASVKECAVVGAKSAEGLTKPHAHVVPNEGHAATPELAEALKAFVRERLAPYKAPREVMFHETLPRTHLGKVDRNKLRSASS